MEERVDPVQCHALFVNVEQQIAAGAHVVKVG